MSSAVFVFNSIQFNCISSVTTVGPLLDCNLPMVMKVSGFKNSVFCTLCQECLSRAV